MAQEDLEAIAVIVVHAQLTVPWGEEASVLGATYLHELCHIRTSSLTLDHTMDIFAPCVFDKTDILVIKYFKKLRRVLSSSEIAGVPLPAVVRKPFRDRTNKKTYGMGIWTSLVQGMSFEGNIGNCKAVKCMMLLLVVSSPITVYNFNVSSGASGLEKRSEASLLKCCSSE